MRRLLPLLLLLCFACAGEESIETKAVRYVRANYNDVSEIILCSVDTVTLGDNLEYRIDVAKRFGPEGRATALDSLKASTDPAVLAKPTAYNCSVQYNSVGNIVWVQLDEFGNLLTISKDRHDWLFNPGQDVPGYLDLILK